MPIATSPSPSVASRDSSCRSTSGAANVGIKAIELYFPNTCVEQSELEKHDDVAPGKYVLGLGQTRMSYCNDREDIYSITLTALSSLLRKYAIDPRRIGRLEVGTETLLDKSKSVKSVLMQLFDQNANIEGVDNINACYGGTNALFNAVNWIESSSWDGRDAIVVAGDIAVYASGAARPTGGAGAVAMLIGPNAPIALQPGLRGSFMQHAYDFYKPDLRSEYPIVQGQYSMECYTRALDACYEAYKVREEDLTSLVSGDSSYPVKDSQWSSAKVEGKPVTSMNGANGSHPESVTPKSAEKTVTDRFDYMCFHSPTTKLVSKSFARLLYNDYKAQPHHPAFSQIDPAILSVGYEESLKDRNIEKAFVSHTSKMFKQRVGPSIEAPTMCGNMYTASLYSGLVSLLSNVAPEDLIGKSVGMFSYGSGLASTLFSLKVVGDTSQIRSALNLRERLEARVVADPVSYDKAMWLRENAHLQSDYAPYGETKNLPKGTYYLTGIDHKYQRSYAIA
ncbi:MAG: 3-hydroxy-3-methylglutaryl coenzyme A synthase [Sclerophora amabilis]|nr:MAG: 3-hydroxy-3-methylglutaryl coenzyme A synthase [Sclerophora amabilis]